MKRSSATLLSAGVSLLSLCAAGAALANGGETTVVPGEVLPPEATLEAGETLTTGVTTTGSPNANAFVNYVPFGTFIQHLMVEDEEHSTEDARVALDEPADPLSLYISNEGTLSILADASALSGEGQSASAEAYVEDAVSQILTAPDEDLSIYLGNSGSLTVGATALAKDDDELNATAYATVNGGLHQEATVEGGGDGSALVTGENSGTYNVFADATAIADFDANAQAGVYEAVFMRAQANGAGDGTTETNYVNSGAITVSSDAVAESLDGSAFATAAAGGGEHGLMHIRAAANGVGVDSADVLMVNTADGTIDVTGTATATGENYAEAIAVGGNALSDEHDEKGGGIVLKGQASGQDDGIINVGLVNDGSIAFNYVATATSTGVPEESDAEVLAPEAI